MPMTIPTVITTTRHPALRTSAARATAQAAYTAIPVEA